jgi:hypothetical protein
MCQSPSRHRESICKTGIFFVARSGFSWAPGFSAEAFLSVFSIKMKCILAPEMMMTANSYILMRSDKIAAFVISITTKLQKKRNMFEVENDKSTRLPAAARQIMRKCSETLVQKN